MIPTTVTSSNASPATPTSGGNSNSNSNSNSSNNMQQNSTSTLMFGIASLILEGRAIAEDEYMQPQHHHHHHHHNYQQQEQQHQHQHQQQLQHQQQQQQQQQQYAHQLLTLSGNNNRNFVVASASQHHQQHHQQHYQQQQTPKPSTSRAAASLIYNANNASTSPLSVVASTSHASTSSSSSNISNLGHVINITTNPQAFYHHHPQHHLHYAAAANIDSSSGNSAASSSSSSSVALADCTRQRLSQKLCQLRQSSPTVSLGAIESQRASSVDTELVTLALDLPIDELEVGYGTHHRHVMPMAVTTGGGGGGGAMSPGGLGSENFLHSLQSLATTCLRGSPPSEHATSPGYRYPISMCASPVSPPVLAGTSPKYNSYRATPPPRYPSPYTLDIPGSGSSNGSGIQSPGVGWFSSPTSGSCNSTTGANSGVDNGSGNARHAFEMRALRRMQNPSTNSSMNKCNTSNAFSSSAANATADTTTTTTTTKAKSGTTYPQQGPHCDQFLRKMGLAKGEAADAEDHICDMSYVNITCSRWRAHCLKMEAIMARCEPICIEVYLGPVAHKILLEQWIIIQKEKVPPPTMTLPSLCSAIRSQLYFSQISAWCDLIKKSDKTIYDTGRLIFPTPTGAAGDLATPNTPAAATTAIGPGGNIGNTTAGNITTSVTGGVVGVGTTGSQATTTTITPLNGGGCVQQQHQQAQRRPRLHIFYRIKQYDSTACFNSKPNVHNFPNVNITENCSLSVCLKSLPRINGGIPKIGVTMPTTTTSSSTITTTATSSGTVSAASALASTSIANVEREMATNGTTTTTTTATPETITTAATSSSSSNGHSLSLLDTQRTSRTTTMTTTSSGENPSDSLVQINCDNNNKTKTTTATRATVIYANANANVAVAAKPTTTRATGEAASSSSAAVAVINNFNTAINANNNNNNNNASTSKTTTTMISSPPSSTATPTTTTTSFTFGTAANGVNLNDVASHNKCKFFIDEDELQDADFVCDDDDSISDSTSISGSGCGGVATLDNSNSSCSTTYANAGISSLSHREKQLLKYRKRMLKRDKKHQRKPLNNSTAVEASCQLQQQRRREHNNNNNNSKKSNGNVQPMEQSEEETCIVPRRQPQHIEMISTGTQTSTNMAACCQQCGNEKSWICLKCSNILSSKHLDDDDMDSTSSISSNISCEIIQTPRNKAELLLQAIQRTPKVAAAKHKKKAATTTVADVVNNVNIGNATQNNNQQLNLASGSSSSALSTVLPPGCQVCKRQKTQHNFTPRSSESNLSNSKMDQKTLDVVVNGGSETKTMERVTNEDDDDDGDGSGDARAGVNGNVNGSNCSNGIDEFDKNEDGVDAQLMEGCEQPDETPSQAAHPAAEQESFITSTKLTPHIERCHLTGRDLRSRTPPNTEQDTNALLLLNCDNAPQFKTPTTLASSSPGSLHHQQQQSKLITTKSPSQKPLQKPNALQITCHYATGDSSDANSATPPSPQQQQHTTLLMRKGLPKVNLTPIFCSPTATALSSSTSGSASSAAASASHTFSFDGTLHSSASAPAVVVSDTANNIPVQKSYSAPTLPNSPSLSPRFAKQAAIYKRRSRHLSDRSDRSSLGSDEQFSDEDLENGMFSPATSPMKQRTRIAAAFGRLPLLGNMEEALLQKRIMPKVEVMGFKVLLGASGGFCPTQLTIPASAYFYELHGDTLSTPYLCEIRLPRKGYSVPRAGTVQATLLNPMGTVVRMFVIPYDMRDMPPLHQTFIRQRILAEASTHETISMQTTTTTTPTTATTRTTPPATHIGDNKQSQQQQQQVTNGFGDDGSGDATKHTLQTSNSSSGSVNNNISHLVNGTTNNNNNSNNRNNNYNNSSNNSNNNNNNNNNKYRLSPSGGLHGESNLGHFISAEHMKRLRYSIHLRFQTSRSGRLSLHTDIRLLISRRTDCDTAAAHAKGALEAPNDLVTDTVMPSNPRYSARQETPSSNSNGSSSSSSNSNNNNNNNTTNINSNNIGGTSSSSSSSSSSNNNNSNNNNCNSKI